MASFTIRQIIQGTRGKLLNNNDPRVLDIRIDGVNTDTRKIQQGDLFIPLVGDNFDGHTFMEIAAKKGAGAILSHLDHENHLCEIPLIKVDNTLRALQDLAAFHRNRFNIPIIAITGSNGKTTTKDMVASVLSRGYNVLKTEGNLNNEIGLPLTLLKLEEEHQVGVIEMGMSALGEIHKLADISRPTIAIITNIGLSHIESLGSKENILKAKMEIFDFFTSTGIGILNGDDKLLSNQKKALTFKTIYYGTEDWVDLRARNIRALGGMCLAYDLEQDGKVLSIELSIPGKHNVYNSLVAIAVARIMGMDMSTIIDGLKVFKTGDMRHNIFKCQGGTRVIDDVYNASPDPMKYAIETLEDMDSGRKIAVLGDMLELGSYSEKAHLDLGKFVAEKKIDILITLGNESKSIDRGARMAGMDPQNIIHRDTNKGVIEFLDTIMDRDDTILVKGSRGMKMEEIVEFLKTRNRSIKGDNS